jgi:hypothetical protein
MVTRVVKVRWQPKRKGPGSSKDAVARALAQAKVHSADPPAAFALPAFSRGGMRRSAALFHDRALRSLEVLAQVPDEKTMQFRLDVCCALDIVWDDYDAAIALHLPRCASQLRQIASQAVKLQECLRAGGAGVHRYLFAAWPDDAPVSLVDCERICEFLVTVAIDAAVGASGGWRTKSLPKHRPAGSGNRRLRSFVGRLLLAVERSGGGQLTANKNYERGSLFDGMELLRPFLPPGMVTKRLPYATLAKLKTEWTKNSQIEREKVD